MSYLSSLEDEFVLGDSQVFREFDMSNFIMNAKSSIQNKVSVYTLDINSTFYIKMVENALKLLETIKLDKQLANNFTSRLTVSNIDSLQIQSKALVLPDVLSIRPQYLTQYVSNIGITIDRVLNNTIEKEEVNRYLSSDMTTKVKKQMVKSVDLPHVYSVKELVKISNETNTALTSDYIQKSVIPFVKSYDELKKQTIEEASNVMSVLSSANDTITDYLKAINNIKSREDVSEGIVKKLNYLMYNATRSLLEAISFLAYAVIRKINCICSNAMTCLTIYNKVIDTVPASLTIEGVADSILIPDDTNSLAENLINGQVDAYTTVSNNIYDFNKGMLSDVGAAVGDDLHSAIDVEMDTVEYNKSQYDEAGKIYIIISQGLDIISKNSDDYLMVFDDLVNKSGFTMRLEDRFRGKVEGLDDITEYTSAANVSVPGSNMTDIYIKMLKEVKDFPSNMETVAKNICDCKAKMDALKTRFERNINGEYKNAEAINELQIFMEDLNEQYRKLTNGVAAKFMSRLKNIALAMDTLNASQDNPVTDERIQSGEDTSFIDSIGDSMMDVQESFTDALFEAMTLEYTILKQKKERGVNIVFEDNNNQTTTTNATTNAAPAQQNNANTQPATTAQQTANKPQTNQTQTQPDNNATNQNQNETKKGSVSVKSITDRIDKWFNQIMEKIKSLAESVNAKADAQYFDAHKNDLVNRNYTNRFNRTPIIDYEKLQPYTKMLNDMKSLATKTSAGNLTPQKIQSCEDEDALLRVVFGNNPPQSVWKSENKPQGVTNYYKTSTYAENKIVVKNGELKNMVMGAITYCETFYTKILPQLKNNIQTIKNNLSTSLQGLVQEGVFDIDFGALFLEDGENDTKNVNTITSMADKISAIDRYVQIFCRAVLTAAFDRYKDYMTLLTSIVPRDEATQPAQQGNVENTQAK